MHILIRELVHNETHRGIQAGVVPPTEPNVNSPEFLCQKPVTYPSSRNGSEISWWSVAAHRAFQMGTNIFKGGRNSWKKRKFKTMRKTIMKSRSGLVDSKDKMHKIVTKFVSVLIQCNDEFLSFFHNKRSIFPILYPFLPDKRVFILRGIYWLWCDILPRYQEL